MSVARRIDDHWTRIVAQLRHQAATGTTAAIITSTAKETTMSEQPTAPAADPATRDALNELKTFIKSASLAAEKIDQDAVRTVAAIKAHPELAAAFEDLGAVGLAVAQGAGIPVGWIADAAGGLRFIRNAYAPKAPTQAGQEAAA